MFARLVTISINDKSWIFIRLRQNVKVQRYTEYPKARTSQENIKVELWICCFRRSWRLLETVTEVSADWKTPLGNTPTRHRGATKPLRGKLPFQDWKYSSLHLTRGGEFPGIFVFERREGERGGFFSFEEEANKSLEQIVKQVVVPLLNRSISTNL